MLRKTCSGRSSICSRATVKTVNSISQFSFRHLRNDQSRFIFFYSNENTQTTKTDFEQQEKATPENKQEEIQKKQESPQQNIEQLQKLVEEKHKIISEKEKIITEKEKVIAEKDKKVSELMERNKEKDNTIGELKDLVRQSIAEAKGARERSDRESQKAQKFALQSFAKNLLEVYDSMQLATKFVNDEAKKENNESMKTIQEGVQMTEKNFVKVLEKHGLKRFSPIGETFNPNLHSGLFTVEDATKAPHTVVHVLQEGWMYYDRVLRPAQVGTSQLPKEQQQPQQPQQPQQQPQQSQQQQQQSNNVESNKSTSEASKQDSQTK